MKTISLCVTNYNRYEMLIECFKQVIHDERISEIIICDDASTNDVRAKLYGRFYDDSKVKLFFEGKNVGVYFNKRRAISYATNEYVISFDSDNIISQDYIDKIYEKGWFEDLILAPDRLLPHFDFTLFSGKTIDRNNVATHATNTNLLTALNAHNFFVNRKKYLEVFDDSVEPITSDSIYFNLCWLKAGYKIHFVEGLHYEHRIHEGSHYQNFNHLTGNFAQQVEQQIMQLK